MDASCATCDIHVWGDGASQVSNTLWAPERDRRQNVPNTWVKPLASQGEAWMPWKECSFVEERLRFVARLLESEG